MKNVTKRRAEQQNQNKANRERRKRAKAPIAVPVTIIDVTMIIPVANVFAPLFTLAEDTRLLDIAKRYNIPLTQEGRLLVETGDTFLPQFEKIEIDSEKQIGLMELGWNPLNSSNLQAVRIDGNDLLIMFHGDDRVYRYAGQADMFFAFNEALSPGRLLWRTIRPLGVEE
jgi:hypothetical protein